MALKVDVAAVCAVAGCQGTVAVIDLPCMSQILHLGNDGTYLVAYYVDACEMEKTAPFEFNILGVGDEFPEEHLGCYQQSVEVSPGVVVHVLVHEEVPDEGSED